MSSDSFKRQREHEDLPDPESFIHERKKHRPLPLRTSPRSSQRLNLVGANGIPPPRCGLSNITPGQSSDDDDEEDGCNKQIRNEPTQVIYRQLGTEVHTPLSSSTPMDIDNSEDILPTIKPGGRSHDANIHNMHIPHQLSYQPFPGCQNIRPGHDSPQQTYSAQTGDHSPPPYEYNVTSDDPHGRKDQYTPRSHRPRLPSPVSDHGNTMTSAKNLPSDSDMFHSISRSQSPALLDIYSMEAEPTDMPMSPSNIPDQNTIPGSLAMSTSGKKLAFFMGYRADCDKCRRRVPGHYSHIIRS